MKYEVTMPSLGADMEEGKLVEWKIHVGDEVKKSQIIASVETTKSIVDIESFREGKVLEIMAQIGDVVPVGKPIALFDIKESSENIVLLPKKEISVEKKFAGLNLRQAIILAMTKSKKEIPHYYLKKTVQLDKLMMWLDDKNSLSTPENRLLLPTVIMRAVALSLEKFPQLNGYYENNIFTPIPNINLGSAFSVSDGVLVAAILDAQKMSLDEFNKAFLDLAERVRNGGIKNREITEGSVTVTNIGDLGCDEIFGIIFPPQVAIIGLGRLHKAPVVDQEMVRPGFVMDVSLSADHRVSDGLLGAKFLNEIDKKLNNPKLL